MTGKSAPTADRTARYTSRPNRARLARLEEWANASPFDQITGEGVLGVIGCGLAYRKLLDVIGDEKNMGKMAGADIAMGKVTIPVIHLLGTMSGREKIGLIEKFAAGNNRQQLAAMLTKSGSIEYSRSLVQSVSQAAIDSLTPLPESPAKESLIKTARFIASRSA